MGRRWGIASYVVSSSHIVKLRVRLNHATQKNNVLTPFPFLVFPGTAQLLLDLSGRTSIFTT